MAEDTAARNVELSTESIKDDELFSAATIDGSNDVRIVDNLEQNVKTGSTSVFMLIKMESQYIME